MNFPDTVKRLFGTPENHTAKVILIAATDQSNFEQVWAKHSIEEYTMDMNENASKLGLSYTPVVIVVNQGSDGHIDVQIALPTQKWVSGLHVDQSLRDTKNIQRITDWLAGFMEPFVMNESVSGVEVETGKVVFGDPKGSLFNMENIIRSISPKKDKGELMTGDLDIGSVEDILAGQMTVKEMDEVKNPVEKAVEEVTKELPEDAVLIPVVDENEKLRITQQEIVDKYGYQALVDLTSRTKQPILIMEPKV